jgi:eukaryotic-like serine/threonine-protein kinase
MKLVEKSSNILGYQLKEKIGAGSYGEVWKAEAPGGLAKALKFVYGYHDEKRAQCELRSLDLIKSLRHPFLLSLERIEIFEGQLIIVSELADYCLNTRLQQCLEEGLPGVPRDQLLRHMREAAEALDYISEQHHLQHLDIKPENILLLSGHVKVADFGLVKKIKESSQSLLGGLTPAYAPPELFDGRPSVYSDQYSLALVYHEMLTGHRVFNGTTTAQLAAQHLGGQPDLCRVPHADQSPLARALAKDPEKRFNSCRELVEALDRFFNSHVKKKQRPIPRQVEKREETKTDSKQNPTLQQSGEFHTPSVKFEVSSIKPPKFAASEFTVRPTLFIGVGQTATRVLRKLRENINTKFRSPEAVPCYGYLAIDTDWKDLNKSTEADCPGRLLSDEILDIPLRTTQQYREDSELHLSWISRRWLYNIPKSGKTERLRPLGRLAFIDHLPKIQSKLRSLIQRVSSAEAIAESAEFLEADPDRERFTVYIVASISGGTGSGVVADLGYTVRDMLASEGLAEDDVNAILIKSTGRCDSQALIETGNALACLSELNHFATVEDWPGIPNSTISKFVEDGSTFANTYLFDIGDQLMQDELEAGIDNVAEYLYLNAYQSTGAWYWACRDQSNNESIDSNLMLRSFGIGYLAKWTPRDYQQTLGRALEFAKEIWVSGNPAEKPDSKSQDSPQNEEPIYLRKMIESVVQKYAQESLNIPSAKMIVQNVLTAIGSTAKNSADQQETLFAIANNCWNQTLGPCNSSLGVPESMAEFLDSEASVCANKIVQSTCSEVPGHGSRLAAVRNLLDQNRADIAMLERMWHSQLKQLDEQSTPAIEVLSKSKFAQFDEMQQLFAPLLLIKVKRMFILGAIRVAEQLGRRIQKTAKVFDTLKEQIELQLDVSIGTADQSDESTALQFDSELKRRWFEAIQNQIPAIVDAADKRLFNNPKKLLEILEQEQSEFPDWSAQLVKDMKFEIGEAVKERVSQTDLGSLARELQGNWLQLPLATSNASLSMCGGKIQRGVVLPSHSNWDEISVEIRRERIADFEICKSGSDKVIFFSEASEIDSTNVAAWIYEKCPSVSELVGRIQSRTDIDWTYLGRR